MGSETKNDNAVVDLVQIEGFQFRASFGENRPEWIVDEPEPVGTGVGPSPDQLLTAAAANCLSASLMFALSKFRQNPVPIKTHAEAVHGRNDEGRLRIMEINVEMTLGQPASTFSHLERTLSQFQNFCTVASSIRKGIPVNVKVMDSEGVVLLSD